MSLTPDRQTDRQTPNSPQKGLFENEKKKVLTKTHHALSKRPTFQSGLDSMRVY